MHLKSQSITMVYTLAPRKQSNSDLNNNKPELKLWINISGHASTEYLSMLILSLCKFQEN